MTDVDPNGNLSVMAKINLSEQKNLPLAILNKTDTFILKFWIKGNNRTITVFSGMNKIQEVRAIAEWTECTIKFEANYGDLLFLVLPAGTYHIWHDKLENGTIASAYDKNQADTENYFEQELISLSSSIKQQLDSISMSVSKQVNITDKLGSRMTIAESKINILSENIELKVSTSDYTGAKMISLINLAPKDILIAAEHLNLVGKVSITGSSNMLDLNSKNYLNNIYDTLQTTKETADNSDDIITAWKYHDKTTIDGSVIETGTVTADKINVADLYALQAKIGNFNIGQNSIYNGTDSLNSNENGVYVGIDGIRNVSKSNTVTIKDGTLYANNANITGGTISGTTITLRSSDEETAKISVNYRDSSGNLTESSIAPGIIQTQRFNALSSIKILNGTRFSADANNFIANPSNQIQMKSNYASYESTYSTDIKGSGVSIYGSSSKRIEVNSTGIGFFGKAPTSQKTVSNKTYLTSVTAQTVGNDLNALKTALRNYGLIA